MHRTTDFIAALRSKIDALLPCYYEEAATEGKLPFAVLGSVRVTDLEDGERAAFSLDVWADEKQQDATVTLERIVDRLRDELTNAVLYVPGVFGCHIGFEDQSGVSEKEFDLAHRRLSLTARIFYN